jgi:superfamily II DNA or RNA helicase
MGVLSAVEISEAEAQKLHPLPVPEGDDPWRWLALHVRSFAGLVESAVEPGMAPGKAFDMEPAANANEAGKEAARVLAGMMLGIAPAGGPAVRGARRQAATPRLLDLRVTFDQVNGVAEFVWSDPETRVVAGRGAVRHGGSYRLKWELATDGPVETEHTSFAVEQVERPLARWFERFLTDRNRLTFLWKTHGKGTGEPEWTMEPPLGDKISAYRWLVENLVAMAEAMQYRNSPMGRLMQRCDFESQDEMDRAARRLQHKQEKLEAEQARRDAAIARAAQERAKRDQQAALEAKKVPPAAAPPPAPAPRPRLPVPAVPVTLRLPPLACQQAALPLADLAKYSLLERAATWWVSNQSDDLLCVPHCRITRLDYQIRAALRAIGPLGGRALLSDEVGLGKTVEAGLVLKELLTRGMVKRFLVLTLPSLVDQWEEELLDKFGLATATSNGTAIRADPARFWQDNPGIVASLHTLKQPAHLAVARQVHWDLLIVDEAHYLRNRTSQAWQAVDALPRQYMLLLTATPVQNSLEELYNLVTLLKPGQLPSPREFRARFLDPENPHRPRDPEELRRLLGQVMIRNTRANSGIVLPPRRAETVLFEPAAGEGEFWRAWDTELRTGLARLSASQASLWGRLLLQTAGSSPAAWRAALKKYPDGETARRWGERAPLEESWRRKCALLLPLTRQAGGVVVFTQFLETQAAMAEHLRAAGVRTFVINGSTPAPERQPLTEEFRREGGALLLTHSGTEGRNLQFCHILVNFDLPWNPMEIEQRIGRLHRLGQLEPVAIHNFVQAGTLQEHLLQLLQEKLNLFELVVGETGLVLGDRYSGDEFEEELFRCWRENEGAVDRAVAALGDELASARAKYGEIKQLDDTLFAHDFESL